LRGKESKYGFKTIGDGKQAHERIVALIKTAIFEKKIKRGERLPPERALAEMFNTSRVTVRSAILTLKNYGLIYVKKGSGGGTFVANDVGEGEVSEALRNIIEWKNIRLQNVIEVRAIIEPEVAYLAATHASQEDIDKIWATIKELEHFFEIKNKFCSSDENFHRALAEAAKNPLLAVFQASLIDLLFKFLFNVAWEKKDKENILFHHVQVAEKVEAKDPEAARKAMMEHISDMQRLLSRLSETKVLKWTR